MPLKKPTAKSTIASSKPVQQALKKAQHKPKVVIAIVAMIPLVVMLAFTLKGGSSHVRSRKAANVEVILTRQTPQEIAEEATTALRKKDTLAFFDILDNKVKDPNIVNSHGDSLLLAAATLGNIDAVQRLLAMGADVNKQNAYTRDTAILRSVYGDHDEISALLVYENADLNLPNNYRQTPMGLAVEKKKSALIDLFLNNGVTAGLDSDTLFRSCAQKNHIGVVAMLKGGVDPNVKNEAGNTPLIISASLGDEASVRDLLAYRADVNAVNNEGNSAVLYAARYNHPETLLALMAPLTMQYKTDIDIQNKRGETALYWGAIKGYPSVVKILLANDAKKDLATTEGKKPLDVAKKYKRTEVIKLLEMPLNDVKEMYNKDIEARNAAQAKAREEQAQEVLEEQQNP